MKRENVENIVALSPNQQGILFHCIHEQGSPYYFEQLNISLTGIIRISDFKEAWNIVVRANESLRSQFRWSGLRQPVQIILRNSIPEIRIDLLAGEEPKDAREELKRIMDEDMERGFRLQEEVPFRIRLIQLAANQYQILISSHHILFDGWSTGILLKEFWYAYHQLRQGKEPVLSSKRKKLDYIKFIHNLNLVEESAYWRETLANPEHASITFFAKRKHKWKDEVLQETHVMSAEQTQRLKQFAMENQMTVAGLCYTAWALVLHVYTGRNDVLFGTTLSGRNVPVEGITDMIGLLIQTLPFRVRLDGSAPGSQLLGQVHQSLLECERHSFYPLTRIMEEMGEKSQNSGFDTLFVVQNYPLFQPESLGGEDLAISSYSMREHSHYPISVGIQTFADIRISASYRTGQFDPSFIRDMITDFTFFLSHLHDLKKGTLHQLLDLHQSELRQRQPSLSLTSEQGNGLGNSDRHSEQLYPVLFEHQVSQTPDQVAVVCGEDGWTYSGINNRANHLALKLQEVGVGPEVPVNLFMERSIDLLVSVLAILKAGGAFVPIDPELPADRIVDILEDTGSPFILVDHRTREILNKFSPVRTIVNVSELQEGHRIYENVKATRSARDLAYVLYTSGTSGKPKGVMIENRNLVHFIQSFDRKLQWSRSKIMLGLSTFSFDIFIVEMLLPLLKGMKIVMADVMQQKDPMRLCELIERSGINIIQLTPTRLKTLLSHPANVNRLQGVTDVLLGGEALPEQLVRSLKKKLRADVYNLYGPTETTVWSTVYRFDEPDSVLIGTAVEGVSIYMIDEAGRVKPRGVPGEICIGGHGVGRGYWSNPGLTRERFVPDPFSPGSRMYRTGDLGRWDSEGQLDFLGRMDRQVKIRGYRIELADVESHLLSAPYVAAAAVIVREQGGTEPYLCAYVVGEAEKFSAQRLREHMQSKLPGYMIPSHFVPVEKLPQNQNGKLDIKALPLPMQEEGKHGKDSHLFTPRSEMEHVVLHLWQDTLSLQGNVSSNTHFMDLGGHSLQAMYLVIGIQKELGIEATVQEIYRYPTLGELAAFLAAAVDRKNHLPAIVPAPEGREYPLSSAQLAMYISTQWEDKHTSYNLPFMIGIKGSVNRSRAEEAFRALIRRHESLRTSFHVMGREIRQIVHHQAPFKLEYAEVDTEGLERQLTGFIHPFELQQAPLFRVKLLRLDEGSYVLLGDLHHIITDNHSVRQLMQEFIKLYQQQTCAPVQLQYKDYALWENAVRRTEVYLEAEQYWMSVVHGAPAPATLPPDIAHSYHSRGGSQLEWPFPEELAGKLCSLARQHKTSIFTVLLTAHYILMHKYTGQEDVIVGVPLSGRWHPDMDAISGMFVNTLPLRNAPVPHSSCSKLLTQVRQSMLQAMQYQFYPLADLVKKQREASPGTMPFFRNVFTMLPYEERWDMPDMEMVMNPLHHGQSKFDLTVTVLVTDQAPVKLMIEYAHHLFAEASIHKWAERYMHVLEQVAVDPERTLSDIKVHEELGPGPELYEEVDFQF
ncbi:amino acid adenylation domain-containing protein [Paenibacillus sp. P96]|uniref:Amino acid adenylation domain-containing protein n=1 Tax=Paenibacillus zeirhizosphaerae TaxID=2987519 RepID=A0ABT9FW56_9BACL|nr:non-ribosomal peptide synthetase [Paenibacillus sp. P96]MDP4098855.1 amino acid adenylation domain-containing protein [Paenibacillus sp. P96]